MPHRFQFSLKCLLVAFVVAACPLAYVAHVGSIVRRRYDIYGDPRAAVYSYAPECGIPGPPQSWLRSRLGDRPVPRVEVNKDAGAEFVSRVRSLFPEADVELVERVDEPVNGDAVEMLIQDLGASQDDDEEAPR